jgi:hypothetical protein
MIEDTMNTIPTQKSNIFTKKICVSESWFERHAETTVQCGGCESPMRVIVSICTIVSCPRCGAHNEFEFEIK